MKPHERGTIENFEDYKRQKDELDRLRALVLGDDYQDALDSLLTQEGDDERVACVISEAIQKRSHRDGSVSESLAPIVDSALQTSIDENPKRIINVIFPILGPAVRKAVAVALADMVQSLNSVLEQSFNLKSLWWRLQARRAGISYAQYALLHTLKYRVEQVLLVHRETGILLHHVAQTDVHAQDPELVSSMLTAITDFVSDSFSPDSSDTLQGVQFGDFQLQLTAGPSVILAAAVRGTLSEQARVYLNEMCEQIHAEFSQAIKSFDGDRAQFDETNDLLTSCLLSQTIDEQPTRKIPVAAIVAMTFVAAFLTFIGVNQFQLNTAYLQVKQQLAAEPGYVLVNHTRDGRLMNGTVLRDPTARSVSQVVSDLSSDRLQLLLDERTVYFELPEFLTQFEGEKANDSIQTFLNEFDQVEATGEQGILKLTGVISQESLNNILSSADVDRNFKQVDVSETTILPTQKLIQTAQTESETYLNLMNKIANVTFYFLPNSLEFTEESQNSLIELVRHLKRLEAIHTEYDFPPVELLIMGFADSQGTDSTNQRISQERANHVQALLLENGVESIMIVSWGVGHVKGSNLSADSQRRVSISVYSELESTSSQGAL